MIRNSARVRVARLCRADAHFWAGGVLAEWGARVTGWEGGPRLDQGWASLSHSKGLSGVGWSRTGPVGVDIEMVRPWSVYRLAYRLMGLGPVCPSLGPDVSGTLGWTDYEARWKCGDGLVRARFLLAGGWCLSVAGDAFDGVDLEFDGDAKEIDDAECENASGAHGHKLGNPRSSADRVAAG